MLIAPVLVVAPAWQGNSSERTDQNHPQTRTVPGNEACWSCHSDIYNTYAKTVMAHASGAAGDGLITGQFLHQPSGVRYRVYTGDHRVWMSYERGGEKDFVGQRELLYFIGSGVKGRTYLFSTDGFLFEAPINWYSQENKWNMTPAYTEATAMPLNLPAYSSCLNCHTSGMRAPEPGTENRFPGAPFAHAGITCERCHGEGDGHIEGKGAIVNPATLSAERRDAICMQCHFEGTAAVEQPGKHLYDFQPGERLSDYVHYFLLTRNPPSRNPPNNVEALSQFEALSLSECKRKSGDKMWCGSCHDAHAEPTAAGKAAYYRGKCLACHGEAFGAKHHAEKPDCAECHMPALPSKDVAHTEATDHRILRYPTAQLLPQLQLRNSPLVSFPASDTGVATTRDFALAWQSLAERGVDGAAQRAADSLRRALTESPHDAELLTALAFVEQKRGHQNEARDFYQQALTSDSLNNEAATNLGMLEAHAGNVSRAVQLWQGAFARAPYRSAIGTNLGLAFCATGQKDEARKYVDRVLEFNPDYEKAKALLKKLEAGQCRQ